jgi:hypothetical protein
MTGSLTTKTLEKWLTNMAAAPAQRRPKNGKPQYKAAPRIEDEIRARFRRLRASRRSTKTRTKRTECVQCVLGYFRNSKLPAWNVD